MYNKMKELNDDYKNWLQHHTVQ